MTASPIEVARLARRLFQQAFPERYWISSAQSIQDPAAPIFATEAERQSFLEQAKRQIAQTALGSSAPTRDDGDVDDTQAPTTRST